MEGLELQRLAQHLAPMLARREALACAVDFSLAQRRRGVSQLNTELNHAGLALFVTGVSQLSRHYVQGRERWGWGRSLDPEDFVMEVLVRLTSGGLGSFDPKRGGFVTWLKATILQTTYSELKRRDNPFWGRPLGKARSRQVQAQAQALVGASTLDGPGVERIIGSESTSERALLEQQCSARFRSALESLTPEEQVLVERAYVFEETHGEIATTLGVTRVAVTRRLGRIREKLSIALGTSFCEDCGETEFAREVTK